MVKLATNLCLLFNIPYIIFQNASYSLNLRTYLIREAYFMNNVDFLTLEESINRPLPDFGVVKPLNDCPKWYEHLYSTIPNNRTKWFCKQVNIDYDTLIPE